MARLSRRVATSTEEVLLCSSAADYRRIPGLSALSSVSQPGPNVHETGGMPTLFSGSAHFMLSCIGPHHRLKGSL